MGIAEWAYLFDERSNEMRILRYFSDEGGEQAAVVDPKAGAEPDWLELNRDEDDED